MLWNVLQTDVLFPQFYQPLDRVRNGKLKNAAGHEQLPPTNGRAPDDERKTHGEECDAHVIAQSH